MIDKNKKQNIKSLKNYLDKLDKEDLRIKLNLIKHKFFDINGNQLKSLDDCPF